MPHSDRGHAAPPGPAQDRSWIGRVQSELNELSTRIVKLEIFLADVNTMAIDTIEVELLQLQLLAMNTYKHALSTRLRRAGALR